MAVAIFMAHGGEAGGGDKCPVTLMACGAPHEGEAGRVGRLAKRLERAHNRT